MFNQAERLLPAGLSAARCPHETGSSRLPAGSRGCLPGTPKTICADGMLSEGVSGIRSRPRKILEWREMIRNVCGSILQQISSQTFFFFSLLFHCPMSGGPDERGRRNPLITTLGKTPREPIFRHVMITGCN